MGHATSNDQNPVPSSMDPTLTGREKKLDGVDVALHCHGCRLNRAEMDDFAHALQQKGRTAQYAVHTQAGLKASKKPPTVHWVQTCTITDQADADARQLIRRLHRQNPEAKIVVSGCYATSAPQEIRMLPGVVDVISNPSRSTLVDRIDAQLSPRQNIRQNAGQPTDASVKTPTRPYRKTLRMLEPSGSTSNIHQDAHKKTRVRAFLKIQDGCNYRCTFCIVPAVRGRSRSIETTTLYAQAQQHFEQGRPEVVLTGAHLGTYGRDFTPKTNLSALLHALLPLTSPTRRLRMGSVDPHEINPALIDLFKNHPDTLCHFLHLPIQSGSNDVLRKMRRAHRRSHALETVSALREACPDIGLGADLIVGFPGETEADFRETCTLLDITQIPFVHVFPYSKRDGTPAATMDDQVCEREKKERSRILRAIARTNLQHFIQTQTGKKHAAVILNKIGDEPNTRHALLANGIQIQVSHAAGHEGRWVDVMVKQEGCAAEEFSLL